MACQAIFPPMDQLRQSSSPSKKLVSIFPPFDFYYAIADGIRQEDKVVVY